MSKNKTKNRSGNKLNAPIELDTIDKVNRAISNGKAMVKFYAPWCGSCQAVKEFYISLAKENPKVKFYQVDVSKHRLVGKEHNIEYIPAFHYYNNRIKSTAGGNTDTVRELLR